ncbi:MAG: O-antigen ligase family protein [Planctomycetes bacterium]|nr:O-antigen ligase family protein [Planctomycetota bacterium]
MMLLTGARSTLAGVAAVMVVTVATFYNMVRSRGMLIGFLVAGAFIAVGTQFVLTSRFAKTDAIHRIFDARAREKSIGNRLGLMQRGLANIAKRPLLGTGYKSYTFATGEKHAIHNDVMLIAAELGLIAMGLYLFYYWKLIYGAMLTRSPAEKWLLRSFAVYFLVTGMAHPLFVTKSTWFFTILAAAIAYRSRQLADDNVQLQLASYSHQMMPEPMLNTWRNPHSSSPSYG